MSAERMVQVGISAFRTSDGQFLPSRPILRAVVSEKTVCMEDRLTQTAIRTLATALVECLPRCDARASPTGEHFENRTREEVRTDERRSVAGRETIRRAISGKTETVADVRRLRGSDSDGRILHGCGQAGVSPLSDCILQEVDRRCNVNGIQKELRPKAWRQRTE